MGGICVFLIVSDEAFVQIVYVCTIVFSQIIEGLYFPTIDFIIKGSGDFLYC